MSVILPKKIVVHGPFLLKCFRFVMKLMMSILVSVSNTKKTKNKTEPQAWTESLHAANVPCQQQVCITNTNHKVISYRRYELK